jgi:hypothetical protein
VLCASHPSYIELISQEPVGGNIQGFSVIRSAAIVDIFQTYLAYISRSIRPGAWYECLGIMGALSKILDMIESYPASPHSLIAECYLAMGHFLAQK